MYCGRNGYPVLTSFLLLQFPFSSPLCDRADDDALQFPSELPAPDTLAAIALGTTAAAAPPQSTTGRVSSNPGSSRAVARKPASSCEECGRSWNAGCTNRRCFSCCIKLSNPHAVSALLVTSKFFFTVLTTSKQSTTRSHTPIGRWSKAWDRSLHSSDRLES